jgi:molecular chaperone DnaK (HSP70)
MGGVLTKLIEANTTIPRKSETFSTASDKKFSRNSLLTRRETNG